jgi:hypothetical protein
MDSKGCIAGGACMDTDSMPDCPFFEQPLQAEPRGAAPAENT